MRIVSIIATRPNIIKEFAMQNALKKFNDIDWITIHTGQHYDFNMSKIFFEELDIPSPNYYLNIGSGSLGYQRGQTIIEIEKTLLKIRPDALVIYGDVNATLSGSIAAKGLNIPFFHLEAGVRGNSKQNPEETNRIVSDILADYNICFLDEHKANLIKEQYNPNKIFVSGDLHYDVYKYIKKKFQLKSKNDDYILLTIHRRENKKDKKRINDILHALFELNIKIKWPVHPGTEKDLKKFGLWKKLNINENFELLPPLGYIQFQKLLKNAKFVFTDSGGVRREAYFWKKPCLVLIEIDWFHSIEEIGWKKTVGANKSLIIENFYNFKIPKIHPNFFGDGNAAEKILKYIESNL